MAQFEKTWTEGSDVFTVADNNTYLANFLGGNDSLTVNGTAFNQFHMGAGDDLVVLNGQLSTVWGDGGNDTIKGSVGADTIYGGDGADVITGGDGSMKDYIDGGAGADTITRGMYGQNATILGGAGDDLIRLGLSDGNEVDGGDGNDRVEAYTATYSVLRGGKGDDTYYLGNDAHHNVAVVEQSYEGVDTVYLVQGASYTLPNFVENLLVENFNLGGDGNWLEGNSIDNTIIGSDRNEYLWGFDGKDTLRGGAGNDVIHGGDENDLLVGGSGNDALYGDDLGIGDDTLDGGAGDDHMKGHGGNDTYMVDSLGDVVVEGGNGYDTVLTSLSSYTLGSGVEYLKLTANGVAHGTGNASDNRIWGNDFANTLKGLGGDDKLYGGGGNDVLVGGAGRDVLTGDAGADVFRYEAVSDSTGDDRDYIASFETGVDRIDLSAIDANSSLAGDQAFRFLGLVNRGASDGVIAANPKAGDLWVEMVDATAHIYGDVDGDGAADLHILTTFAQRSLATLTSGDFLF